MIKLCIYQIKHIRTIDMEEFYTAEEVAQLLKVHYLTIYRHIKAGKIKAHKIGNIYRISKTALEEFLENTRTDKAKRRGRKPTLNFPV